MISEILFEEFLEDMMKIYFIEPWEEVINNEALEKQLTSEVSDKHLLYGLTLKAVARRGDNDDVLYYCNDLDVFYIVHLTWSKVDLTGKYPQFVRCDTWKEFETEMIKENKWFEVN